MSPPSPACGNCGGTEFLSGISAGGVAITSFFIPPKLQLRVCGTCGLVDWFLPMKEVRKLKKKVSPGSA
jgi:hypothetical protein